MGKRYSLGIDFGTLSARAVLLDLESGQTAGSASYVYPHGVMSCPPGGSAGGRRMELQDPADYTEALERVVREVLSGEDGGLVAAVGIDFTSCTPLPLDDDLTPLCSLPKWRSIPDAWPKLWRSFALPQGKKIAEAALRRGEPFLEQTCGKVSPEWLPVKLLEVKEESPELYRAAAYYMEAGDWLVSRLVGEPVRSANPASFKCFYRNGFPGEEFFEAVDPSWTGVVSGPLRGRIVPVGQKAGKLCREAADRLGLPEGIPVGGMITDAHAGVYASGAAFDGGMLSVLGTSACHMLQSAAGLPAPGAAACVKDGLVPGLWTYEATHLMGDGFERFVGCFCPESLKAEAAARGENIYAFLNEKAAGMMPGESGLTVLDWFGGNRCILGDSSLTGVIAGLTLRTEPAEIYHALLEAAAFSMKVNCDNYETNGLSIRRIVATGGLARKNAALMQIISDVMEREIAVCSADEGPALGSAVYASSLTGERTLKDAVRDYAAPAGRIFRPDPERAGTYRKLDARWLKLHDLLGREHPELIRR